MEGSFFLNISLYSSWNVMKYHFHTSCYDFDLNQEKVEVNTNSEYPTVAWQVPRKIRKSLGYSTSGATCSCKALHVHVYDQCTYEMS
jgi:hypothetical protein